MSTITIDLPDALKDYLEHQVHSGRFKDRSSVVQNLIAEAVRNQWRQALDETV